MDCSHHRVSKPYTGFEETDEHTKIQGLGDDGHRHMNNSPDTQISNFMMARQQKPPPLTNVFARHSNTQNEASQPYSVDNLMAKLAQHAQQRRCGSHSHEASSDGSATTNPYEPVAPADSISSHECSDLAEVHFLKRELELVRERMARMDLELSQSRFAQQKVDQALGSPHAQPSIPGSNTASGSVLHNPRVFQSCLPSSVEALHHAQPASQLWPGSKQNRDDMGHRSQYFAPSNTMSRLACLDPLPNGTYAPHMQNRTVQQSWPKGISPAAHEYPSPQRLWGSAYANQQQSLNAWNEEPLNYRRLLDRSMSCDWSFIVDKIVRSNDQQASIFLQQKLKVGSPEQRLEIVQSIIDQAYPLMVNRFGNFLVQRCFEHGTAEQIVSIANAIRGNTLNLSMDAFGCHVVQKAFDCVPEEYKAIMIHELLRRIPETVIHRYACHVWQKLFELRWSGSPPQIMKYVNESLRGMWHEVALGETGSLVVQNIFENCLEEDKRPCISEVIASMDVVAHGQFGNWCIQHICEHGSPQDQKRAIDQVIRFAREYSMDQFASKVVEKCLKVGGSDFLDRYLDRVCESHQDRPRMSLIDIAGDQFGNYLVQYILSNADPARREIVANHIRKHMVSLRGSKYGSRVAMLCCNPAYATRPGPPASFHRGNLCFGANNHQSRGYTNVSQPIGHGNSVR